MMNPTFKSLLNLLKSKGIRLSHHRLKVLEYLANNFSHPTVEQIYIALHEESPTLSKTTVYNTLNLLVEVGLVRVINIEDNETRYDITTKNHGHFKCESCGKIYDFGIDLDSSPIEELKSFKINYKDVYFKGICPSCLSNIDKTKLKTEE